MNALMCNYPIIVTIVTEICFLFSEGWWGRAFKNETKPSTPDH